MARVRKRTWTTSKGEMKTALVVDWLDNNGNRQRKHFEKKRDADAFRIPIENQLLTGIYRSQAQSLTVEDLTKVFLAHCQERASRDERMTERNYRTYKGHIHNHILNTRYGITGILLVQLSSAKVNDFKDRMREQGTTVPTTRRILATLRSALEFAKTKDLVAINPARGIRVIGPRDEDSKKIIPPSKRDVKLLTKIASEDFQVLLRLAASTGVRASGTRLTEETV